MPLDESAPLLTPTETTQSTRAALVHWAEALTETYVQGAFARAAGATPSAIAGRVVARRLPAIAPATAVSDLPDPFALFERGRSAMRTRLATLSRPLLLELIVTFGLNPAGHSLSWLRDHQLVTFIVTATEAQLLSGKRGA